MSVIDASDQPIVHTPGPWSSSCQKGQPGHCFAAQVWDDNGDALASVRSTVDPRQATADALLIAASPDLLDACTSFLRAWHGAWPIGLEAFEKFDEVHRKCSQAVEKATRKVV